MMHERVWLAMGLALLCGCQRTAASPSKTTPPAKVAHVVNEADLNTIKLTPEAVERLGIKTATVEQKTMRRTRPYGAELMLPTGASVVISAPLMGTVQLPAGKSFPHLGEHVAAHAILLELLPLLSPERAVLTPAERIRFAEAKNTVAQSRIDAEGQVQQAQVQVQAAEIALARAERLRQEQAGTIRAVDEAKAQLSLAQKSLEAAQTRKRLVENLKLDEEAGTLSPLLIEAPQSGILRNASVKPGEIVPAGAILFEVMNDDQLWVRVSVYVGDLDEIDSSAEVTLVHLDGRLASQKLEARPLNYPPLGMPLAAAMDLYYELPNADHRLNPGQRLTALLPLKESADRRVVPWSAVMHDIYGGQWVYEQTQAQEYVRRRVEVEWVAGDTAVLARGPAAGVVVVTAGAAELAGTEFGFAK